MSNTTIPTALQFVMSKKTYSGVPPTPEDVCNMMIEFAKLHLEAQRKAMLKKYYEDSKYSGQTSDEIHRAYNIEENVK